MALNDIKVVGTISGNAPQVITGTPKAASTFRRGEWVRLTSGDTIAVATNGEVVGVAAEDAVGETGYGGPSAGVLKTTVKIWPLNTDTLFEVPITGGTLNSRNLGKSCDIEIDTGTHGADLGTTTVANVKLHSLNGLAEGATSGRIVVVGIPSDNTAGVRGNQWTGSTTRSA